MLNFYKTLFGCGSDNTYRQKRKSSSKLDSNSYDNSIFTTTRTTPISNNVNNNNNNNYNTRHGLSEKRSSTIVDGEPDAALSARAKSTMSMPSVTIKYNMKVCADAFDPISNPQGYVDLGLAENKLCEDLITEKLDAVKQTEEDSELRYYPNMKGLSSFRMSLKQFLEREFNPCEPIDADDIVVACGLTALLDTLAFAITDPGDYIMTTSPYYYRIKNDFLERAGVHVLEVPLVAKPKTQRVKPYTLDVDILEEAFLEAEREGKCVKAIIIVNPNNPLGDVYTARQLTELLDFAARYQLHIIVDEIYAMSVFDLEKPFTSVLALHHPDPDRVHFLWGFSKDFGLSGYRCGILYTTNKSMIEYLSSLGIYQLTPPVVQMRLKAIIDDDVWLQKEYWPALRSRLRTRYEMFHDQLMECGVEIHHSYGGIFIWMDAGKYLPEHSFAGEEWLFEQFMKEKVFLLPGKACHSVEPGYFRIVFSLGESVCSEGLKRIKAVLQRIAPTMLHNGV